MFKLTHFTTRGGGFEGRRLRGEKVSRGGGFEGRRLRGEKVSRGGGLGSQN